MTAFFHKLIVPLFALLSKGLRFVIPVVYMGLLLTISALPVDESAKEQKVLWVFTLIGPILTNLMHIPAYGLLAFLWRWCLGSYVRPKNAMYASVALTIGFGIFQEWYQSLIPGRYASFTDILFDAAGVFVGLWCFNQIESLKRKPDSSKEGTV